MIRIDICEGNPQRTGWNVWHKGNLRFNTIEAANQFDLATYSGTSISTRLIDVDKERLISSTLRWRSLAKG